MHKRVQNPGAAALEAAILRELHKKGVAVPEVLDCQGYVLTMAYLPGEPLPDLIERGNYDQEALATALCDWFASFYAALPPGESRGDVNGRNFLFDGAKIHGVDFEERCFGSPARDAGRLAAFLSTYDTRDPQRQAALAEAFILGFAARFGYAPEDIRREQALEFSAMRQRRA